MNTSPPTLGVTDLGVKPGLAPSWFELRRLDRIRRAGGLTAWQLTALKAMIDHARKHVPLYRDLYPADLVDRLTGLDDVRLVPFTDKNIVRAVPEIDRRSGPIPARSRYLSTSGSSGEPLPVVYPPGFAWYLGILRLRLDLLRGLRPWHRRAVLGFGDDRRPFSWRSRVVGARMVDIPSSMGAAGMADEVLRLRPAAVLGHGQLMVTVGESLGGRYQPRVVATYGEVLDAPTRDSLTQLMGCRPLDHYATAEHGTIAWQCREADLYHLEDEAVLVEVLDDGGRPVAPGECGDVVLTGLLNPLVPFLRYRVGDTATLADRPCACGLAGRAIAGVGGRAMDWVLDGQGRRVAPQRLWLMEHLDRDLVIRLVRRYQVNQAVDGRVVVQIVPRTEMPPDTLVSVESSYRRLLGPGVEVEARLVDELELDRSGKFRLIRSDRAVPSSSPG